MTTATLPNAPITSMNGVPSAKRIKKADKVIKKFTIISTGGGLIPNPIASVGATVGTQIFMVKDLCELYNVPYEVEQTSLLINSIIGSVLTKAISVFASTIIPSSKPLTGPDFSGAAICGLYTATVGEFYKDHFENGGTLADANLQDLASFFMQEIENGDIGLSSLTNPSSIMKTLIS